MTDIEYEQYLYGLATTHIIPTIKKTLAEAIKGGVYYAGKRPRDSEEEDAVISFASGVDTQIATGVLMLNIFVPDQDFGEGQGETKDLQRVLELSKILQSFRDSLPVGEILFEKDATIRSYPVNEINQHYINLRLKFNYNGR